MEKTKIIVLIGNAISKEKVGAFCKRLAIYYGLGSPTYRFTRPKKIRFMFATIGFVLQMEKLLANCLNPKFKLAKLIYR
ncbi:hypothetical protein FA048_11280 [Pedobacter polaris]|uniref:Uncharacterized protein n=1 Tax=Pedobacter polaris TaxID=2571273 RepID=A0A4U1CT51_9SPHI|nr:hypothetical protein [Pedobacter polaris]TKC10746.1 hypothetical protein FA048_11280 [Pedobacter polaris]